MTRASDAEPSAAPTAGRDVDDLDVPADAEDVRGGREVLNGVATGKRQSGAPVVP